MPSASFYERGLRFECTACGKCCTNRGAYTFVYLTEQDIVAAARLLGLTRRTFLRRHTRRHDRDVVIRDDEERCRFLDDEEKCAIYAARPLQCRTFPFWPENLNRRTWNELKKQCEGIDRGKRVPLPTIEARLTWDRAERYPAACDK